MRFFIPILFVLIFTALGCKPVERAPAFPVTEVSAPESKPIEFEVPENEPTRPVTPVNVPAPQQPAQSAPAGYECRDGVCRPIQRASPVRAIRNLPVLRRFGR